MRRHWLITCLIACCCFGLPPPSAGREPALTTPVRIGQLSGGSAARRRYANALPSLLEHIRRETTVPVVPEPVILTGFDDEALFDVPFVYVNFADRSDWVFSAAEIQALRDYLNRGGFLFIDAGINAAFLRDSPEFGQHHSFGEWEACPEIKEALASVFPRIPLRPLPRSHPLYRSFYVGLPDTASLPETVRSFVEQEKWPDGTYASVGLTVGGRLAVLITPIIAMGWGRNSLGDWSTTIRFRIREETEDLSDYLRTAAYSGSRFEVTREDGGLDTVYCQKQALPAWAREPGDRWRVFRYYGSREISDFAHVFYTQLGTNILIHALTH